MGSNEGPVAAAGDSASKSRVHEFKHYYYKDANPREGTPAPKPVHVPIKRESSTSSEPSETTKSITKFAWCDEDKFVRIYVDLEGVGALPSENVSVAYGDKSVKLTVRGLQDVTLLLDRPKLSREINAAESKFKVKENRIVISLRKKEDGKWYDLNER